MKTTALSHCAAVPAYHPTAHRSLPARLKQLTLTAAAALALVLAQAASAAAPPLVDLGTLGGSWSNPNLINNAGMVVGNATLPGDTTYSTFVWSEATGMVALPAIGVGVNPAYFLSDAGLVGGIYTPGTLDAYGNPATQGFLWSAATGYRFLGTLGGSYSNPSFVNSAGTVVGSSTLAGDAIRRSFVWTAAGGMSDIGSFGGEWTIAQAINASGQVIGYSATADGNSQPFIWDAAQGLQPIVTGLYSASPSLLSDSGVVWGLGGESAGGQRIYAWSAASGVRTFDISPFVSPGMFGSYSIFSFRGTTPSGKAIVGAWVFMGNTYSFVIDPVTGPQLIIPPGCNADGISVQLNAVSKSGYAVGSYQRADIATTHAFIWDEVNGARSLGVLPGGTYSDARAVNNRGEVTGYADTANGEQHAFLWTAASGMTDLGTLGGSHSYGTLIGDSGLAGDSLLAGDQSSHAFFVKLAGSGAPDLTVTALTTTNNKAPQGQKVTVTAVVKNTGNAAAGASTTVIKDGTTVLATVATPALGAGDSVTLTLDLRTAAQNGTHVLSVATDTANVVAESSESNNTKSLSVTIKGNKVL